MKEIIFQPVLLGLSSGIFCMSYCFPFLAPFVVLEERKLKENFKVILKFIFGKLFGYLLFGAIFGYLGEKITNKTVDLFFFFALAGLSFLLILYSFGLMGEKRGICLGSKFKKTTPFLMGFLMGINVCPPFLMAINYVFLQHAFFEGILFFFLFFLATTIYFLPITFLGFLNKIKEFRMVARISGILVGLMFLFYSFYRIAKII
jgi:sulfite exporter TauE/SafE